MADLPLQQNPRAAYVYEIVVDGTPRYVGKGRGSRAAAHIREARRIIRCRERGESVRTSRFYNRLASAIKKGRKVSWRIVAERLSDERAFELEREAIAAAPVGQLWNLLRGGEGGDPEFFRKFWRRPGTRLHQSEQQKRVWETPGYREHQEKLMLVSCGTAEFRARRSEEMKQRYSRQDYLEGHRKRQKDRWQNDRDTIVANLQRGRDDAKARGVFRLRTLKLWADPEYRVKVAEGKKRGWTAEARYRVSEAAKIRQSDPAFRAKVSEKSRANWADPEYRARQIAALRTAREKKRRSECDDNSREMLPFHPE